MTPMPPIKSLGDKLYDQCISTLAATDLSHSPHLCPIERSVARGSILFHDGDHLNYLYQVVSGMIRTCRYFEDGRRQLLGFFSSGDFVGTPCTGLASCTAAAITTTKVLCYPVSQITEAMSQSFSLTKTVLEAIHRDAERHMAHVMILSRRCPDERVASFLLSYCTPTVSDTYIKATIDLPMSRIDIADYLGLTQETVCRVLTRLRQANIIKVDGRHKLTVNNLSMLQTFAESGASVRNGILH